MFCLYLRGRNIKITLEFLTRSQVEHYLLTDSRSARQLVSRQGTGRVKHVAGRILWLQDHVRENEVMLVQVPTLWNLSDVGTKALGAKRLRLLLHELSLAVNGGSTMIGEEEYYHESNRLQNQQQVNKLSRRIAQVMVFMGLGPRGADSQSFNVQSEQCDAGTIVVRDDDAWMPYALLGLAVVMVIAWLAFGCTLYRC